MPSESSESINRLFFGSKASQAIAKDAIKWKALCSERGEKIEMKDALIIAALANIADAVSLIDP